MVIDKTLLPISRDLKKLLIYLGMQKEDAARGAWRYNIEIVRAFKCGRDCQRREIERFSKQGERIAKRLNAR